MAMSCDPDTQLAKMWLVEYASNDLLTFALLPVDLISIM